MTKEAISHRDIALVAGALRFLENGARTTAQMSLKLGLPDSTTRRLMQLMAEHGLVTQLEHTREYIPGELMSSLADVRRDTVMLKTADEVLAALRERTGATAVRLLRRHRALDCLCIAQAVAPGIWPPCMDEPEPIPPGPVTRIFLAWPQPTADGPDPLSSVIRCAPGELAATRRMKWAQSLQPARSAPGRQRQVSLAVPILDSGRAIAALLLQGTPEALGDHPGLRHGRDLLAAARELRITQRGSTA